MYNEEPKIWTGEPLPLPRQIDEMDAVYLAIITELLIILIVASCDYAGAPL